MRKSAAMLAVTLVMAIAIPLTGCGSSSSAVVTYVARADSGAFPVQPTLYTLDVAAKKSTAVSIPLPAAAEFISANGDASAATYCHANSTDQIFDIFLMGTDGKEKQLTTDADACESVFSPDGKTIAYVSAPAEGDPEIFTMNVDGTNQKALYAVPADTEYQFLPEFSPDGKSLVFYIDVISTDSVARSRQPKNAHVSSWMQALNRHTKDEVRGSVQPQDGAPTQSGWYTMALTDTTPTLVYATTSSWGPAVFSADGKKLLLSLYDTVANYENISSINLDGTGLTQLTTSTDQDDLSPVPYGDAILFNRSNTSGSHYCWDIYIMDQTGANQALVHSTADTYESLMDTYYQQD